MLNFVIEFEVGNVNNNHLDCSKTHLDHFRELFEGAIIYFEENRPVIIQ